jgi:hypothetical protein
MNCPKALDTTNPAGPSGVNISLDTVEKAMQESKQHSDNRQEIGLLFSSISQNSIPLISDCAFQVGLAVLNV